MLRYIFSIRLVCPVNHPHHLLNTIKQFGHLDYNYCNIYTTSKIIFANCKTIDMTGLAVKVLHNKMRHLSKKRDTV